MLVYVFYSQKVREARFLIYDLVLSYAVLIEIIGVLARLQLLKLDLLYGAKLPKCISFSQSRRNVKNAWVRFHDCAIQTSHHANCNTCA